MKHTISRLTAKRYKQAFFESTRMGVGYVNETGMKKCVQARVEAGSIDVSTMTRPSVNIIEKKVLRGIRLVKNVTTSM